MTLTHDKVKERETVCYSKIIQAELLDSILLTYVVIDHIVTDFNRTIPVHLFV